MYHDKAVPERVIEAIKLDHGPDEPRRVVCEEKVDEPRRDLASTVDGERALEDDDAVLERLIVVPRQVGLEEAPGF